jgi:hypothetical protein
MPRTVTARTGRDFLIREARRAHAYPVLISRLFGEMELALSRSRRGGDFDLSRGILHSLRI